MIKSKLPDINNFILSEINRLTVAENIINLGDSHSNDIEFSPSLNNLILKNISAIKNNYCEIDGLLAFRKKISSYIAKKYDYEYNPKTEITVTAGPKSAINTAITAIVRENEEVIIIEPAYEIYTPIVKINGGVPVYVKLNSENYSIDWVEMNKAITARTRMIIFNSPHNPTGKVFSKEDLEKLNRLVAGSKIIILSDEVFAPLTFNDNHQSVSSFPELVKRSIVIGSFSKILQLNGWNTAYVLAPEELKKEFRKFTHYFSNNGNNIIQHALAEHLQQEVNFSEIANKFAEKQTYLDKLLEETEYTPLKSEGTYFKIIDYSAISNEKEINFAKQLLTEFNMATVPMSAYYHDKLDKKQLRICFAKPTETLNRAVKQLVKIEKAYNTLKQNDEPPKN